MDMNNLAPQFASIVYNHYNVVYLTEVLNASTMNDVSNLGLNEDEQIAYNNIMSSRQVTKELNDSSIITRLSYDNVNDPGNYLPIALEGQDAPEITGTVHLPQGGTRKSNVKFWYPGQVYEEGAKGPVIFPENDKAVLGNFASTEANNAAEQSKPEISGVIVPFITEKMKEGVAS